MCEYVYVVAYPDANSFYPLPYALLASNKLIGVRL